MAHIKVEKGLNIPLNGEPINREVRTLPPPKEIALNLSSFEEIKFKLLVKVGDKVKIGEPLALDKAHEERLFVSPGSGVIKEIRRGEKRRLLNIVIDLDNKEESLNLGTIDISRSSRDQIIKFLARSGLFSHIRQRPFNVLANPKTLPRSIFVKATDTAPLSPPTELIINGYEDEFSLGLKTLCKLTDGPVHMVVGKNSPIEAVKGVERHTIEGPYPASNASVHIYHLDPIKNPEDIVWTLNAIDVITIGFLISQGEYFNQRIISIGGCGLLEEQRGYFVGRMGHPIGSLIAGRNIPGLLRMISGDVLTGQKVDIEDFLHFDHNIFSVVPENSSRESFHFFRAGLNKFTASRTYASGLLKKSDKKYNFTTSQHGEYRGFVEASVYQNVMPMDIPVVPLIKAIQAEDYDLADELGLLEVDAEDFALPTFVCPSKQELMSIVSCALRRQAAEALH